MITDSRERPMNTIQYNTKQKGEKLMKMTFNELKTIYETLNAKADKTESTYALMRKAHDCMAEAWPEWTAEWDAERNIPTAEWEFYNDVSDYADDDVKQTAIRTLTMAIDDVYDRLYENENISDTYYQQQIEYGDMFIENNQTFVKHLCECRNDIFSSDMEVVALAIAIGENADLINDVFSDETDFSFETEWMEKC